MRYEAEGKTWTVRVTVVRATDLPACDNPLRDANGVGLVGKRSS